MLQQTPVGRVLPAWVSWMQAWPSPRALAAVPAGEALRAWGRLGYPRRAIRLHATAAIISEQHNGEVPSDYQSLLALPGIGTYTAAAIQSFAFGIPSVVLDVNVRRVLSRAWAGQQLPKPHITSLERALAQALVDEAPDPISWAAASMELGALVCTRNQPACHTCPLVDGCSWYQADRPQTHQPPRKQARFQGSDRQARGAILKILRDTHGVVPQSEVLDAVSDGAQATRALESLVADGLVITDKAGRLSLPT